MKKYTRVWKFIKLGLWMKLSKISTEEGDRRETEEEEGREGRRRRKSSEINRK